MARLCCRRRTTDRLVYDSCATTIVFFIMNRRSANLLSENRLLRAQIIKKTRGISHSSDINGLCIFWINETMAKKIKTHEELESFYQRPGFLMRRNLQMSVGRVEAAWEPLGITRRQFDALYLLAALRTADQDRIAIMLGLDRSNIGVVLKILERKGLVTREQKASDRRKLEVKITREGLKVFEKAQIIGKKVAEEFMAPLSPAEQKKFVEYMQRIVSNAEGFSTPPLDTSV